MHTNTPRYLIEQNHMTAPQTYGDFRLVHIGRRFCNPSEQILPHIHWGWFELTIVTKGTATVVTNGDKILLKKGDIHLSLPGDIHSIQTDPNGNFEYDFFAFSCEKEYLQAELQNLVQQHRESQTRIFHDERIPMLVNNALSEFSQKEQMYSRRLLENIFEQIVLYVVRIFKGAQQQNTHVSENEILCLQAMQYIDTHIYIIEHLEDVAENLHYDYSYLSMLFKKTTGKTLFEYYQTRKMETAKALLSENKKSVGEVAEELRYSSPYAFSRAFKQIYGLSPKQYTKSLFQTQR